MTSYTCCSKTFVATTLCIFCHDKTFVTTNVGHNKSFVATNTCLSQQNLCCIMHTFVVTKDVFCHDRHMFVLTKLFVVTKLCLLSQKLCHNNHTFVERKEVFCLCEHVFVATKIMLVPMIVPVLTILSSVSLSSGILPTAFKQAVYQMGIEERRSWGLNTSSPSQISCRGFIYDSERYSLLVEQKPPATASVWLPSQPLYRNSKVSADEKSVHAVWLCYKEKVSMLYGFVSKKKCPCCMALLQRKSIHAGEKTFHKALCNLCNRELKITFSGMIACACGMNKRSVECECVCMRLMSDSSVDGMTVTVLHWLCATQVKK